MSDDQSGEATSKRPLTTAGVVIRLGAIGVAVLCVAGAFAYTGGWLSPRRLTEDRMLAAFTDAEGLHRSELSLRLERFWYVNGIDAHRG